MIFIFCLTTDFLASELGHHGCHPVSEPGGPLPSKDRWEYPRQNADLEISNLYIPSVVSGRQ